MCVGATSTESSASSGTSAAETTGADSTTNGETSLDSSTSAEAGSSESGGAVDLDDWTKRREIILDNPNGALDDFQVPITLPWSDALAPDLSDLRFTDASGTELLAHHVESFVAPVDADVWVRVPAIAGMTQTSIYAWYGNPAASSIDDPEATFDFWEPFDGAALDGAAWVGNGDYEVAGGTLTVSIGSVYSTVPLADQPGTTAEVRMLLVDEMSGNSMFPTGLTLRPAQGALAGNPHAFIAWPPAWQVGDGDTQHEGNLNIPGWGYDEYVTARISMAAGTTVLEIDMPGATVSDDFWFDDDFYVILGSVLGADAGADDLYMIEYDWVRTRRFALAPIDVTFGPEEDV
jgi:hypothetical protein